MAAVRGVFLFLIIDSYRTYAVPVVGKEPVSVEIDSESYALLRDKGYIDSSSIAKGASQMQSQRGIVDALKRFQDFAGIPKTGRLDDLTKVYMKKPRCGMADMKDGKIRKRKRRYNHHGSTWKNPHLTWALENSNDDGITDTQVRHILTRAFHKWQSVTNLFFTELYKHPINSAQIRVRFETLSHGDPFPFDGHGGVLAHAFYPMSNRDLAGDVHFDDDETYTLKTKASRYERKLLWVAVHEIGHSIGLDHSPVTGAIMWPYYQNFDKDDFDLTHDDIMGIQTLYGGKLRSTAPTIPTRAPTRPTRPTKPITQAPKSICTDKMKAAFIGRNNRLYFVNNKKMYMLKDQSKVGIDKGPLPIDILFKELPKVDKIDAVFEDPYYRAYYVFHGDQFTVHNCYRKSCQLRSDGRPRKISDGFQNIKIKLENIDAAFIWPGTDNLYLFKDDNFWRLRSNRYAYIAEHGYPQKIAAKFHGLPKTIDTVFKWTNHKIYFTKGKLYYRWDERRNEVRSGYPIELTRSFLNC